MRVVDPGRVQSAINVTPLVDVVLVLLIIFMVIAPQLANGPDVDVPDAERPPSRAADAHRIVVALEHGGAVWIDDRAVAPDAVADGVREAVGAHDGATKVVIKADARLSFGEVRRAMLAIESGGAPDVGLVAERREPDAVGG